MFNVIVFMENGNLHAYNKCISLNHTIEAISITQEVYDDKCRTITFRPKDILKIEILESL